MVVGVIGLNVEDILVSLVLSIILSWEFRILAHEETNTAILTHEENQYSYVYNMFFDNFLSKALKQTKAGPLGLQTPSPV